MSNIQEAIKLLKDSIEWAKSPPDYGCDSINKAISLLESEPEPGELYVNTSNMLKAALSIKDGQGTRAGSMAKMLIDCCKEIDRLTAELKAKEKEAEVRNPTSLEGVPDKKRTYCYSCGTTVKDQKYCHGCGKKLNWQTLKEKT